MNSIVLPAFRWLILFIIAGIGFASLAVISHGLEDLGAIRAFSTDEFTIVELAQRHLKERSLDPHGFYYYGHLYDSIGYFLLRWFEWLGWHVDVRLIGMTLRLMSLAFGMMSAAAMFRLGRVVGLSREMALISSALLFTMPDFVFYMRNMHPDTLQVFLLVAGMAVVLGSPRFTNAMAGAVFAGLAFSTKYNGLFLLPFCFLPHALVTISNGLTPRRTAALVLQGLCVVSIFVFVYAVTNPYGVRDIHAVISTLQELSKYTATGHGKIEPANPSLWLAPLVHEFQWTGIALFTGGIVLALAQLVSAAWQSDWRGFLRDDATRTKLLLLVWVLVIGAHLLTIRIRVPRYTFHFFPILITLAILAYWDLLVRARKATGLGRLMVPGASILLAGFLIFQSYRDLTIMGGSTFKPESEPLVTGHYIGENFPASTRVLMDFYSYVPPKFKDVRVLVGITAEEIETFKPDVLIFNRYGTGRWIWKASGTKIAEQKFVRDLSYPAADIERAEDLLVALLAPSSDWLVKYELDGMVVFTRK